MATSQHSEVDALRLMLKEHVLIKALTKETVWIQRLRCSQMDASDGTDFDPMDVIRFTFVQKLGACHCFSFYLCKTFPSSPAFTIFFDNPILIQHHIFRAFLDLGNFYKILFSHIFYPFFRV